MQKFDQGLDLWQYLAETINAEIQTHGELQKNNKAIWSILHKWTNREWLMILHTASVLQETNPECFHAFQNKALAQAARILVQEGSTHHRILDTKEYKNDLWRMTMCLREVWNSLVRAAQEPKLFSHD